MITYCLEYHYLQCNITPMIHGHAYIIINDTTDQNTYSKLSGFLIHGPFIHF